MNLKSFTPILLTLITAKMGAGIQLDSAGQYNLDWTMDPDRKFIEFTIQVATTGFLGLGWSPDGTMTNADLCICSVTNAGDYNLDDYHVTGTTHQPVLDDQNNCMKMDASQTDTHTTCTFRRLCNTGDPQDVVIDENGTNIIYSWGQTDAIGYHGPNRGTKSINFFAQ